MERQAVREPVVERHLERVVGRVSDIQPGIGDAVILRERLQRLADGSREVRKRNGDIGKHSLSLCQRGRGSGLVVSRDPSGRYCTGIWLVKGPGDARAGQPVAGAGAVGDAQHQVWRKRMLDVEAPVFVIGRFSAKVGIAVGHRLGGGRARTDRRPGRGGDKADAIAGIEERRVQRVARVAVIPDIGRLAGDGATRGCRCC